jgi:hypothetical protein
VPGLPYPPIDLEDLGPQAEGLAGDALACQAEAERGVKGNRLLLAPGGPV